MGQIYHFCLRIIDIFNMNQNNYNDAKKPKVVQRQQQPLLRQIPDSNNSYICMFKEKAYDRAESIYRLILEREPQNVDAINSLASCLRAKAGSAILDQSTFGQISSLYQEALHLDRDDVEANFNLALLYLQSHPQGSPDFGQALHYLMQSIKKDKQTDSESGVNEQGKGGIVSRL